METLPGAFRDNRSIHGLLGVGGMCVSVCGVSVCMCVCVGRGGSYRLSIRKNPKIIH